MGKAQERYLGINTKKRLRYDSGSKAAIARRKKAEYEAMEEKGVAMSREELMKVGYKSVPAKKSSKYAHWYKDNEAGKALLMHDFLVNETLGDYQKLEALQLLRKAFSKARKGESNSAQFYTDRILNFTSDNKNAEGIDTGKDKYIMLLTLFNNDRKAAAEKAGDLMKSHDTGREAMKSIQKNRAIKSKRKNFIDLTGGGFSLDRKALAAIRKNKEKLRETTFNKLNALSAMSTGRSKVNEVIQQAIADKRRVVRKRLKRIVKPVNVSEDEVRIIDPTVDAKSANAWAEDVKKKLVEVLAKKKTNTTFEKKADALNAIDIKKNLGEVKIVDPSVNAKEANDWANKVRNDLKEAQRKRRKGEQKNTTLEKKQNVLGNIENKRFRPAAPQKKKPKRLRRYNIEDIELDDRDVGEIIPWNSDDLFDAAPPLPPISESFANAIPPAVPDKNSPVRQRKRKHIEELKEEEVPKIPGDVKQRKKSKLRPGPIQQFNLSRPDDITLPKTNWDEVVFDLNSDLTNIPTDINVKKLLKSMKKDKDELKYLQKELKHFKAKKRATTRKRKKGSMMEKLGLMRRRSKIGQYKKYH